MPITVEWQRLRFGQLIVGEIVGPPASVVLVGVVREVHVDAIIITAGSADVDVPRRVEVFQNCSWISGVQPGPNPETIPPALNSAACFFNFSIRSLMSST